MAPVYLPGYDTEQPSCIEGVRRLVAIHRRLNIPATFFLVGVLVEHNRAELQDLLADSLFAVGSHSYSHANLAQLTPQQVRDDLCRTHELIVSALGKAPLGLRTPGGYDCGYRGRPEHLAIIAGLGYCYLSSQGWGPGQTMPAPVVAPYTYAEEGFPELLEVPMHGWHENILTRTNPWQSPFAPPPPGGPATREEWLAPFLTDLQEVLRRGLPYHGPTMHPWSLRRFDPECGQVEALLQEERARGLAFATFDDFVRSWRSEHGE